MNKLIPIAALALAVAPACKKETASSSKPAAPTAPAQPVAVEGRRIDVKVTKSGYQPEEVQVKAGEQVTLVFTRTEDTECGSEVLIPSVNAHEKLPLNQPVAIKFKADQAGPVRWSCGMGMMKGTVVVN